MTLTITRIHPHPDFAGYTARFEFGENAPSVEDFIEFLVSIDIPRENIQVETECKWWPAKVKTGAWWPK